ncbi:hypothetical protein P7D22_20060 [Lichenihabitans sp. Uapishka_5]|uniref:hypothetical protein n=1 Tax=Lichenihabitans sp. Uapishka_5 TaxID=3037302 RepID=UPI0029E80029|nr:hypothetical protein [Lichenihabitans sp. Uapishka_5]MDX7953464.1 hypothetical protein [Lichenihabitans sp. Uapishka_5]
MVTIKIRPGVAAPGIPATWFGFVLRTLLSASPFWWIVPLSDHPNDGRDNGNGNGEDYCERIHHVGLLGHAATRI